jgi:hypothetical protein
VYGLVGMRLFAYRLHGNVSLCNVDFRADFSMRERVDNPDFITRYFLRRLAIARRKRHINPLTPFNDAKVEVILIALAAPLVGMLSFFLVASLRWLTPAEAGRIPLPSKLTQAIVLWVLCYLVGSFWLNRKFRRYRDDPTLSLKFDTASDRQIVFWQKIMIFFMSGILMPMVGSLVAFWPWLRAHLF